jgi:L-ribulokinase
MRFESRASARATYDILYGLYKELHDAFGGVPNARPDLASLMKRLLAVKDAARTATAAEGQASVAS